MSPKIRRKIAHKTGTRATQAEGKRLGTQPNRTFDRRANMHLLNATNARKDRTGKKDYRTTVQMRETNYSDREGSKENKLRYNLNWIGPSSLCIRDRKEKNDLHEGAGCNIPAGGHGRHEQARQSNKLNRNCLANHTDKSYLYTSCPALPSGTIFELTGTCDRRN